MSLPSDYIWSYWKGGHVPFSYPRTYYTIYIKNVYGDSLYSFDVQMYPNNNLSLDAPSLASNFKLNINYFRKQPIARPTPSNTTTDTYTYFTRCGAFFKNYASYYVGRTYNGFTVGSYVKTVKKHDKNYTFYFTNCYIQTETSSWVVSYRESSKYGQTLTYATSHLYKKDDTRIPTNCCIKYLCNPTKYKKA